ncbi:secondary thiamine-phosphate synthase enzyme YjbQ [Paenibacillus sp. P26]|nr:secondary thiamine-phosphate synthase enzyme YjbQ [Paenibacillus sp. P26]UUZ95184.1 secondary thiamine-phosphate synthase enzyme YjbQ [Paenibacillus sp. P25]
MIVHKSVTLLTEQYNEMINITDSVRNAVAESAVANGIVAVISMHTTTGITVNEYLECLAADIGSALERLVPEDMPYIHARMLHSYGSTAGNPTGHLKSMLVGNHCLFPIVDGRIEAGARRISSSMNLTAPPSGRTRLRS